MVILEDEFRAGTDNLYITTDDGSHGEKGFTTDKLKELIEAGNKYDEVIVYCGSGITACPNSLALSEIGIEHKVYPGSFSDWISYDDNQVDIIKNK